MDSSTAAAAPQIGSAPAASAAADTAVAGRVDVLIGPPFGPEFFARVLIDRVRLACGGQPDGVPVVELHLADGFTLDLCHLPGIERQWLAAQAYRDKETCEEMDLMFVPYSLVTRVTVSMWHRSQRPIGFVLDHAAAEHDS